MAREKCVLAYSGGMDSTISTVWIQENYNMDVVTLTVDLGAGPEIVGVKERAAQAGAIQSLVWDVRDEFVNEYVFPGLKAGAMYEGVYALSTALGRPLMAKKLVEAARQTGAVAVAHGCTGKGNDQVRFDSGVKTLSAHGEPLRIIAPAREWGMSRDEEKQYAAKAGLELREVGEDQRVYSIDRNLWGQAIEGEDLEDTWVTPPEDAYSWTRDHTVIELKDKFAPVIIEGGLKEDYSTLDAFMADVLDNDLKLYKTVVPGFNVLVYSGCGEDAKEIVFNAGTIEIPTIGGEYIDYSYPMVFDSPYMKSEYKSGKIELQYGEEKLNLDF